MECLVMIDIEGIEMRITTKYKNKIYYREYDLLRLTEDKKENIKAYLNLHKEDYILIKYDDLKLLKEIGVSI